MITKLYHQLVAERKGKDYMKIALRFSQLSVVLSGALVICGCTKKSVSSQSASSGSISGMNHCMENKENWTEFQVEKDTMLYHWTNVPLAAKDPWAFLTSVTTSAKEMNMKGNFGTLFAGNGLYLAMDPFQSASYGKILVQLSVRAGSRFAGSIGAKAYPIESATKDCPGTVFAFDNSIRAPKQAGDENDPSRFALALYDLGSVDPDSVRSFQTPLLPQAGLPVDSQSSGLQKLLTTPGFNAVIGTQLSIVNRTTGRTSTEQPNLNSDFKRDLALQCMGKYDLLSFPKMWTESLKDKEITAAFPEGPNPESVRSNVDSRMRQVLTDALEIASDNEFLTPEYFCSSLTDEPFKRYNPQVLEEFLKSCGEVFDIPENQRVANSCAAATASLKKWAPAKEEVTKFQQDVIEFWTPVIEYWTKRYTLADWKMLDGKQ